MTTSKLGGSKYPLRRYQIDEIQQKGFIELLILHPAKNFNRRLLDYNPGQTFAMYEVIIATTTPKEVESAVLEYLSENSVASSDYLITLSTSRFQDVELRNKYPTSVRVNIAVGVPFNYVEIIRKADAKCVGSHYLATPYNNGLFPTSNVWFEIPENKKVERMDYIAKIMSKPKTTYGEDRVEKLRRYDTALMHHLLDLGIKLKTHIGYNIFNEHAHSGDEIDSRFSVCVRANNSLNRTNPIIQPMQVIGVDCVTLKESIKYAKLIGMDHYLDMHTDKPMLGGMSPASMNGSKPKTYFESPEYTFARRVAKSSGRFTYFKTCLADFLESLQRNEIPSMPLGEIKHLVDNLLVIKIRVAVNKTEELVGEQNGL